MASTLFKKPQPVRPFHTRLAHLKTIELTSANPIHGSSLCFRDTALPLPFGFCHAQDSGPVSSPTSTIYSQSRVSRSSPTSAR